MPLIVGGDSAGGNLAAVVAQRARDRDGPHIALQVLVYPVTDADFDRPSYIDPENQLMLTRDAWCGSGTTTCPTPRAARSPTPRRCAPPTSPGLPPAVVLTAEYDVLRDEGEAYADRLQAAGVPVDAPALRRPDARLLHAAEVPGLEQAIEAVARVPSPPMPRAAS